MSTGELYSVIAGTQLSEAVDRYFFFVGLFSAAVSESGTALAAWALRTPQVAKQRARAVGQITGCQQQETRAMVECLRKVEADELVLVFDQLYVSRSSLAKKGVSGCLSRTAKPTFPLVFRCMTSA